MGQASVIQRAQQLPSQELNLGGTSTVEKVFRDNAGNALVLPFPASSLAGPTGRGMSAFRIRAMGRVTGGGVTNFTPQLLWGTSTVVANNTDLESGVAGAADSASGTWRIDGEYTIDWVSGLINGFASNFMSGSNPLYTPAAKADLQIGIASTPALKFRPEDRYGFVISGTFSAGFAQNKATVEIFQLEMLA